ncbi:hypothetical protein GCM10022222_65690 [Amycolatopsis ultiminotia]|uniref:Uncharacterized protein n=1 Tax=Amycolatopsis ultiminotia TaxID=543629 RepID=A0ABP6XTJ8_9PSEU
MNVTYTSGVGREPPPPADRCPGMRVRYGITPPAAHSTGVAAAAEGAVTLGVRGYPALRRPRETPVGALHRPGVDFGACTGVSLRAVTGSRSVTSPGSGAVADGVMKLTCSAIRQTRRQGGVQPMSLAPEAR